jgi:hypothetical protein
MFQDLTQSDILNSIDSLLKKGYEKSTQYRVWYHGSLVSPKDIIREAYSLKGVPNPNPDFNTDQAQQILLALGFPIVEAEKAKEGDFFSAKDLTSFSSIASRSSYNSKNPVDNNIAKYLNKIPWGKAQAWAKALENKNWIIKGGRNWNVQDRTHGQSYKKYTWFRVFPRDFINKLIFFTVGIGLEGDLVYKMDIYRDDEAFPKDLIQYFDDRCQQLKCWRRINRDELENYSWETLIDETDRFFTDQLDNYFKLTKELWPDERMMRLTWNENNWEFPSHHDWHKKYQGTSEAHERQYGFGHEEWLFNSRYRLNGFQYGYIRGVNQMSREREIISKLLLFTIDPVSHNRYLVGRLNDVEIIEGYEPDQKMIQPVVSNHFNRMLEELADAKADITHFRKDGYVANVKFEWAKAEILVTPSPLNEIKGGRYNRFQPYRIDEALKALINEELRTKAKLSFVPGKAAHTPSYEKSTNSKRTTVERRHGIITDDLYNYLLKHNNINQDELSCEKTRVGGQIVDLVIKRNNALTIFEVKTESAAIRNIRLAIGQLLEYALLDSSVKLEKLVIVGPADLVADEQEYFQRIQSLIGVPIEYWGYSFQQSSLEKKFRIYT